MSIAKFFLFPVLVAVFLFSHLPLHADQAKKHATMESLMAMSLEELMEVEISIATRNPMPVRKAPAIATVISADEIRLMGAMTLLDVLERVPGIGVNRNYYSVYTIEIRGLKAIRQNKIKFMVDGHSINMPTTGEPFWSFEDIAVEQVERLEIIRGPGSALYGANAFSGIINVVTKSGRGINGTRISVGGGSFDTARANILHGRKYGDADVMASLAYTTTEGARLAVEEDAIGRSGRTDDWARSLDGTFKISWEGLVLESRYNLRNQGPYIGVTNAVNDESELDSDQFFADLSYSREITDAWNANARAYYDFADVTFEWQLFPPGMVFSPSPFHFFPDGVFGIPHFKNRIYGLEIGSDCNLTENNTLTLGAVYEYSEQYDITHHTNFHPLTFVNLGSVQDISPWGNWNIEADRINLAAYIQDEWNIRESLALTAGLRYDHYDDVGSSTNPRLGLVWEIATDLDLKLLYGEAFRIPTMDELYSINNPASVGNPDLEPEEMTTYEASVGYHPANGLKATASGFYNEYTDKIDLVPTGVPGMLQFRNTDDATIYGLELDAGYRFRQVELYANYSWNHAENDSTGDPLAEIPDYRWNLGLNFFLANWAKGNLHVLYVGERPRAAGDLREDLDGYTVVDANFILYNFFETLELRASVYNLLDEEYAYPAPALTLANDYPAPGRSFFLEARFTF